MTEHTRVNPCKARFCPSPTGFMHLGNLRTALFNALWAKHNSGCFLLRIEDTDQARSKAEYTQGLLDDLTWLGLLWQEGPEVGGNAVPYFQSQRQAIYDKFYQQLIDQKIAYPCFCSEEQLRLQRRVQLAAGKPPRYDGRCRGLSADEVAKRFSEGQVASLRFHVPDDAIIEFHDGVHGAQTFLGRDIGDFIIRRTDGTAPFMFCNAVDDALMGVTHVLRGEDHLSNTPRQLLILKALGLNAPSYVHMSLIVGDDGAPLSKRHGSESIALMRKQGYLPAAIINYLARVGHHYKMKEEELLSLGELAKGFSLAGLSRSPAHFDAHQLMRWQQLAVQALSEEHFRQWAGKQCFNDVPVSAHDLFVQTVQPNVQFPADVCDWQQRLFSESLSLSDDAQEMCKQAGQSFFEIALQALVDSPVTLASITDALKANLGVKGKKLFMPLRVALTGLEHGPEMGPMITIMPDDIIKARFSQAALCAA